MNRQDYGTGYYVRSTAHPIAPDTGLSVVETIAALNTVDDVYNAPPRESDEDGELR
jgi:hypothetical protein